MTIAVKNLSNYLIDNAAVRAWGAGIKAGMGDVGLVNTADTGQVNWTTTTFVPSSANQLIGYEVWRFDDALQATAPVFLRLEYRTSSNYYYTGILSLQVGTETNGAGTLTGAYSSATAFQAYSGSQATGSAYNHYFASDKGFFTFAGPIHTAADMCVTYVVDRWRNTDGVRNGQGVSVWWNANGTSNGTPRATHVNFSVAGLKTHVSANAVPWDNTASKVRGVDIGMMPVFPADPILQSATPCVVVYFTADITPDLTQITLPMYGVNRNMLCLGAYSRYWASASASVSAAILYE